MLQAPVLQFQNVSKSYSGNGFRSAIQDISFTADTGKTLVLIGPSGCGKSTILRLIMGLVTPDSGTITIHGHRLSSQAPQANELAKIREKIGYVIQNGGLFPHLTARQNLELRPRVLGWSQNQIEARISALTKLTRISNEALNQFPTQLSGGQAQRVGLMRALMLDPPILLFDEPLGALDPIIRSELQDQLRQIFQSLKKTVILVTHDLPEAAFFGQTLVLLRNGKVVQQGSLPELSKNPADPFVTKFINAQRSPREDLEQTLR